MQQNTNRNTAILNQERTYLGTLCKRNHTFEQQELSLRFVRDWTCTECRKMYDQTNKVKKAADVLNYYHTVIKNSPELMQKRRLAGRRAYAKLKLKTGTDTDVS